MTITANESLITHRCIDFMLLTQRLFLQLIDKQINALNKIQLMTSIKLLYVSAPGAFLWEFYNKGIQDQQVNPGIILH
jgi:hypothetical protein